MAINSTVASESIIALHDKRIPNRLFYTSFCDAIAMMTMIKNTNEFEAIGPKIYKLPRVLMLQIYSITEQFHC